MFHLVIFWGEKVNLNMCLLSSVTLHVQSNLNWGILDFHYLSPLSSISAFQIHYKGAWFNILGLRHPYTFGCL